MRQAIKIASAVILASTISFPIVHAATSDWIDGFKIKRHMKKLEKNEEMPVSIKCKAGKGREGTNRGMLFQVTSKPNPELVWWWWAWNTDTDWKKELRKPLNQGYKPVSTGKFAYESGLLMRCAILHHPTKRG